MCVSWRLGSGKGLCLSLSSLGSLGANPQKICETDGCANVTLGILLCLCEHFKFKVVVVVKLKIANKDSRSCLWPHPTELCIPDWELATPTQTAMAIMSGMGKAMDCKFGRYIHRVHLNKSPWKIWEKRECGHIQGLPKFFEYPLLSQEWVKLQTSNFVRTIIGSMGTKAH